MTAKGKIIRTNGSTAVALVQKSSACGHNCGECRLCSNPKIEVEILNPIGASEGDTVLIGTESSKVLLQAFLLYIAPILGIAAVISVSAAFKFGTILTSAFTLLWICLWFSFMRYYSKKKVSKSCALEVLYEED